MLCNYISTTVTALPAPRCIKLAAVVNCYVRSADRTYAVKMDHYSPYQTYQCNIIICNVLVLRARVFVVSVRVNGLILGKFMSTLNPALHLKLPVDARNGARNILVCTNLELFLAWNSQE